MRSIGKCALCHEERELCNSHIIPEFFYKFLYDDKHRFKVVPLTEEEKERFKQKGLSEYLLCEDCETKLNKYETYTSRLLYGNTRIWLKNGNPIQIKGINYDYFKLFQLSIIFRASVSSLDYFENINIGPHEERIREMLINDNPGGKNDYPCLFIIPKMKNKVMPKDFIFAPQELGKFEGHRVYRFIFGGFFWIYLISSHTSMYRFKELFLDEDGSLLVPVENADEFFYRLSKDMFGSGKP